MITTRTWIVPAIAIALMLGACEEEPEVEPVADVPVAEVQPTVPPVPPAEPIAQTAGIPVSQIIESPATWTGRTVAGEVRVAEVVSDRGFWVEDQGERIFVVVAEPPQAGEKININPGQTVRLREARIYTDPALLPPGQLEPQARNIAQQQSAFLGVDAQNIDILGQTQ